MSIENSHLPKVPDFPPQDPTNNETATDGGDNSVPGTAYELLGGVPGDAQASAANFQYPSSVGPQSAWTPEQLAAYNRFIENDPNFKLDPTDSTFVSRLTEQAAPATTPAPVEESDFVPRGTRQSQPDRRKWLIGGGTVAAIGATVWALIASTPHDEVKKATPENTSSPVTNSSTAPTGQETIAPVPTTNAETFVPKSEVILQTTPIEAMEAMPVEAFAQLSPADRFAYFKIHSPNSIIDTPSKDEITSHPEYITSLWQWTAADALGTKDLTVGKKMYLASLYYTVDKSGALSSATQTSFRNVENIHGAGLNENLKFISSGQLQHGVDRNGKAIDFIDVTAHQTKVIGGAETPDSLQTYQAIREHIKMLNGQEYIVFFQGYTEKGHTAPDSSYPY